MDIEVQALAEISKMAIVRTTRRVAKASSGVRAKALTGAINKGGTQYPPIAPCVVIQTTQLDKVVLS